MEGGIYISPEFQLGQVYMGEEADSGEDIVLYRPIYVTLPHDHRERTSRVCTPRLGLPEPTQGTSRDPHSLTNDPELSTSSTERGGDKTVLTLTLEAQPAANEQSVSEKMTSV